MLRATATAAIAIAAMFTNAFLHSFETIWQIAAGSVMRRNYNRSWPLLLVFVGLVLQMPRPVRAFVMTFNGGSPRDPGAVRTSEADVLYATDRDGREVKLICLDSSLNEGMPLDLGMPSVGPDGTVSFGVAFRRNNRVRW